MHFALNCTTFVWQLDFLCVLAKTDMPGNAGKYKGTTRIRIYQFSTRTRISYSIIAHTQRVPHISTECMEFNLPFLPPFCRFLSTILSHMYIFSCNAFQLSNFCLLIFPGEKKKFYDSRSINCHHWTNYSSLRHATDITFPECFGTFLNN